MPSAGADALRRAALETVEDRPSAAAGDAVAESDKLIRSPPDIAAICDDRSRFAILMWARFLPISTTRWLAISPAAHVEACTRAEHLISFIEGPHGHIGRLLKIVDEDARVGFHLKGIPTVKLQREILDLR